MNHVLAIITPLSTIGVYKVEDFDLIAEKFVNRKGHFE